MNKKELLDTNEIERMTALADEARARAYVEYSGFHVGACLKTAEGAYYLGCNIENAAYTPTICAERTALFKAVSEGERSFAALAVISDSENFTAPCGVCRQALAEFCPMDMPIILANRNRGYVIRTLGELLPLAFTGEELQ